MEGRSWCCSRVCGAAVGTAGCWVGGCGEAWMGPVPAEDPGKALSSQETNLSPSSPPFQPAAPTPPAPGQEYCPRLVFSLHVVVLMAVVSVRRW